MELWALLGLVCGALLIVLWLARVDLTFNLQARGEPDGGYAVAGGAKVGPFLGTFVLAQQVPPRFELLFLGRPLRGLCAPQTSAELWDRIKVPSDPGALIRFLLDEKRRFRWQRLDIDLEYSFRNVALTGQLVAAIAVVSAALPAPIRVRQTPSWELTSRALVAVDAALRLWPGLIAWDGLRFWVRRLMLRRGEQKRLAGKLPD